ncbi:glycosyltransferase [Nitrospirillum amazonense]|uniref:Glycosyl transferase family 1 n=1 Tax=Nitrospirillum amazonense TaxID=28077 RepID=A0A560F1B2_9PROT|nr:glycosyltransferase [Nitrospirillum amazonense]MEC4589733.1 glycosyltransferase [Nitrospirillum amazonense]TWB15377.1 glycosyl transferase family 1 [Nitrospirillum amazonense]
MDSHSRPALRIAFVTTRDLAQRNGRTPIMGHILVALRRQHTVEVITLHSVLQGGRADRLGAAAAWLASLASGRPPPLQCLLYAGPREAERVAALIAAGAFDAVYLDTVRCQTLLRTLRRTLPDLHIVTDFDDLMSRRMTYLRHHRLPLLTGHVGPHFPRWARRLAEGPLARLVTAYEARTLPAAEREVMLASSATVLLSPVERQMLCRHAPADALSKDGPPVVRAIPPGVPLRAEPWGHGHAPLRFVFIGSDRQLQNRTAIDFLLDQWRRLKPATPLHIHGRQTRPLANVPGVRWHGYADDLAQVYRPGSIALVPALVAGGIKTKVAEAWAWGCPVLGNRTAMEGLRAPGYPLTLPEDQWGPYLTQPEAYADLWADAARKGAAFVRRALSPAGFERAWEMALRPKSATRDAPAGAPLVDAEQASG